MESYALILLFHVLFVIIAVGAATVTDYLHLVGLRRKVIERQLSKIYPSLSKLINISLIFIILTGIFLVAHKPEFLTKPLFLTKMALVAIVVINGLILQKIISPNLDLCVMKGTKYCSKKVLYSSAISGSISIVTWYSLVILALTKNLGYTVGNVVAAYLTVLFIAISIACCIEKNARTWRG